MVAHRVIIVVLHTRGINVSKAVLYHGDQMCVKVRREVIPGREGAADDKSTMLTCLYLRLKDGTEFVTPSLPRPHICRIFDIL